MAHKKRITKIIASTIMLTCIGAVILVGKKQELIAAKHPDVVLPAAPVFAISPDKVNQYGTVMARSDRLVDKAIVEHIALNVPKTEHSDEKIVRYGQLVMYPNAKATVLICHGFMTSSDDVKFLRQLFPEGELNFMTFDFRAHGKYCDGQRCTFGRDEYLDVTTAAYFVKNHPDLKDKPLIAYAFSMGAAASIEAQSKDQTLFAAMILDCPFDSTENIIKKGLESLKFTFLGYDFSFPACNLLQKYVFHPYVQELVKGILKTVANLDTKNIDTRMYPVSPVVSIQKVHVPCFFIHCKNDEKIGVDAVKSIYQESGADYKILWLTNGRRHFDSYFYNPEKYVKEIRNFIDLATRGILEHKSLHKVIEDPDEFLAQI